MKKILLIFLLSFLLVGCGSVKKQMEQNVNVNLQNQDECGLVKYGLNCEITKFLENNLAWKTEENSVDFCAYELLGEENDDIYLSAFCEEFYVQDKEIICPDEKTKNECFLAKDKERKICKDKCNTLEVEPYLVLGSGVSIPVKITKKEGGFSLWEPRDGSLYDKDLKATFPKDIYKKLSEVDGGVLKSIIVKRAEEHFGVKAKFNISGEMDKTCTQYLDCKPLPFEYAAKSNCPHEVNCLDGRCVAGCYDFFDYTRFPRVDNNQKE